MKARLCMNCRAHAAMQHLASSKLVRAYTEAIAMCSRTKGCRNTSPWSTSSARSYESSAVNVTQDQISLCFLLLHVSGHRS